MKKKGYSTAVSLSEQTPNLRMELIEWNDHWGGTGGWHTVEALEPTPLRCMSIGFILHESQDGILLANSVEEQNKYNGVFYILKSDITKRKKVRI